MCAEEGGRGCRVHHRTTVDTGELSFWCVVAVRRARGDCTVRFITFCINYHVCRTPAHRTSGREPGALLSLRLNYHESSNHADIRTLVIADGVG